MNREISKELAFFNLLKSLILPNLRDEKVDYTVSMEDLEEKMEMDKTIISKFLSKLQEDGLVEILERHDNNVCLHFERTHEKLLEILSVEDIELAINESKQFILNNLEFFTFAKKMPHMQEYAEKGLNLLNNYGHEADFSEIISRGINELFDNPEALQKINSTLFEIVQKGNEDDIKFIEGVLYCQLNLPASENPFYVTLFLTILVFQIEHLKREK